MALYTVSTGKLTLTESATKSLILLNPVTVSIKVRQLDISLAASAAAEEIQFDLYRVATLGTPEGEAATPALADERDGAATSSALIAKASEGGFKKEPTAVTLLASYLLQPLGGVISIPLPYGAEVVTKLAGARLGVRYVSPAVKPACIGTLWFEE